MRPSPTFSAGAAAPLGRHLVSAIAACTLLACSEGHRPSGDELAEVTPPAGFGELEPAVQRQLGELFARVEALDGGRAEAAGEAHGRLGMALHAYQYFAEAERAYANAEALAPADVRWPYFRAHVLRNLDRAPEATAAFERALALRPAYVPALVWAAELELEAGRPKAAEGHFLRALEERSESLRARVGLAKIALDGGRPEAALEQLEMAMAWDFESAEIQHLYGLALRARGEAERAAPYLERGRGHPNDRLPLRDPLMAEVARLKLGAKTLAERARSALEAGRHAEALELYREAVAAAPDWPYLRLQYASALEQMGHAKGAVRQLEETLDLDPGNALAHVRLGSLLQRGGDAEAAAEQYRRAIASDPGQAEAHFELARLLQRRGETARALPLYDRAVELDPTQSEYRLWRVFALLGLERAAEALALLEEDLRTFPADPDLRLLLASLLATTAERPLRDGARALELARALYRERDALPHAEAVAAALAERGQLEAAVAWQRACLETAEAAGVRPRHLERLRRRLERYRAGQAAAGLEWPGKADALPFSVAAPET